MDRNVKRIGMRPLLKRSLLDEKELFLLLPMRNLAKLRSVSLETGN